MASSGFGYVWMNQGVEHEAVFLSQLKERLRDMCTQEWADEISRSSRYDVYRLFKTDFGFERYLDDVKIKCFKETLTRFRLGISDIKEHKNRYKQPPVENSCPFCTHQIEDETHFLFVCSKYDFIRPEMLKNIEPYNMHRQFTTVMSCKNIKSTNQLAWFIFKFLEIRATATQD